MATLSHMAQGIKNRDIGDIFYDESNKQIIYLISDLRIVNDIPSFLNLNPGSKIANKKINSIDKFKTGVAVTLTRKRKKLNYTLIRLYEKEFHSMFEIPHWGGQQLKDDFDYAFQIKPRLKSSLASQTQYSTSKLNLSSLNPKDFFEKLYASAKKDQTGFGKIIQNILYSIKTNEVVKISNYKKYNKEIGIYFSEVLVPLLLALNKTNIKFLDPKIILNSKSNHIGYDAKIIDGNKEFLLSIKQSGNKIGAYSSIRFIKLLIAENREKISSYIGNIQKFEQIIDSFLDIEVIEKNNYDSLILDVSRRKTYKNLFTIAELIELQPELLSFYANELAISSDEIKVLNQFANKLYEHLNNQDWFIELTSKVLKIMNFIQCKLIINYDEINETIQVLGVDVLQLDSDDTKIEFSGRKSYFSNVLSTGHGGFLLKHHSLK